VRFLLDSNAWVALLRQNSAPLLSRLQQHVASEIALCSVVLGELWLGAHLSGPANKVKNDALIEQLRGRHLSLPFDDGAAAEYARIRAHLSVAGQMIGPNDLLIAATALASKLTLVTHNTAEFSRVPGLKIEDWQIP
jgi:tRNA(fMet)-specific endonuclease VapC